jgi:hypothetical protein
MSKQPTDSQRSESIHSTASLFRAVVVFGMLGWGTFFGVGVGLFSHYVMRQSENLVVSLGAYLVMGWGLGLLVGWANRKTWGVRDPND